LTTPIDGPEERSSAVTRAILDIVSKIPSTSEHADPNPRQRAGALITAASLKAAAVSGTLAVPAGPLSLVTILPDLYAVWRIQAQLVADIAALFGKDATLTEKQMMYCLFKHAAAQAFRDIVTRVGERVIFRRASLRVIQALARRVGVRVTQRLIAKSLARWLPIVGAGGVAAYAAWDTRQVGKTSVELFAGLIESETD
jgi:hypothetical protein